MRTLQEGQAQQRHLGLNLALEKAETLSAAKDDFLAALSHELRTPLTPILLAACVDSEELTHIFTAFSQGRHAQKAGSQNFGGLGLGLAISQKVVEKHQGRIWVESEGPGRGSIFSVEIPIPPENPLSAS